MPDERKVRRAGYWNFLGGQDSGRAPNLIGDNTVAQAINKTMRGGYCDQRPSFVFRSLAFVDTEQQTWITTHRLQGWSRKPFIVQGASIIVFSSGGRLFRLDPNGAAPYMVMEITPTASTITTTELIVPNIGASTTVSVTDADGILVGYPVSIGAGRYTVTDKTGQSLTLTNLNDTAITTADGAVLTFLDPNPERVEQVWMYQADKFFIIQDGESKAIIYNGSTARRADPMQFEVPTGTAGAFIARRIWQVTNKREIHAGDILLGPTEVISFKEERIADTGGFFISEEDITAISSIVMPNRIERGGPVLFFTATGAFNINVPANRSLWNQVTYPIVTIALLDQGATGQYAVTNANSDLFYRASDGVRSFRMSSDQYAVWGSVPDSREMTETFKGDTEELLCFTSSVVFDNRLLQTSNGARSTVGVYHRCIAALDFDLLSGIGRKERPVWDGIWTGIQPVALLAGTFAAKERCFAFARNRGNGLLEFWEVLKQGQFDYDSTLRVTSAFETRAFSLYTRPDGTIDAQKLEAIELWVDKVSGSVDIEIMYRPEGSPGWYPWGLTKQICVKKEDCEPSDPGTCKTFQDYRQGYRTRIGFGAPLDYVEPMEQRPTRLAYAHEFRVMITGACRVKRLITKASIVEDPPWRVTDGATCTIGSAPQLTIECGITTISSNRPLLYVRNETTGLWHLIRARNVLDDPGGIPEFFLDQTGIP